MIIYADKELQTEYDNVDDLFTVYQKSLKKSEEMMLRYFTANFSCGFAGGSHIDM